MNDKRRNKIKSAIAMLSNATDIIDRVYDEESDCVENMPENLQTSERYESMLDTIDALEEANSSINEVIDQLNGIVA